MDQSAFKVSAAIAGASFIASIVLPLAMFRPALSSHALIGVLLFSAPFALVLLGHFLVPKAWARQMTILVFGLIAWLSWCFFVFVAIWMHAPLHVVALTHFCLMGVPLTLLIIGLKFIGVRPSHS